MANEFRVRCAAAALALLAVIASGPAMAQMMGGDAAAAGNGVGGRAFGDEDGPPTYDPVEQYNLGLADLRAGKFHDADRDFDHALMADPRNVDALTMQGEAREGESDMHGAAHDFERALKIDPTAVAARRDYAIALAKLGQAPQAQAQYAMLKIQSDACAGACANAADLKAALAAVEAALSPAGAPAAG